MNAKLTSLLLSIITLVAVEASAERNPAQVYNDVLRGNFARTGNSIMTCDRTRETAAKCNDVELLAGVSAINNNNTYTTWIDIDGVVDLDGIGTTDDTYNSSRGTIAGLPATAQIEWAGLYWSGNTRNTGTRTATAPAAQPISQIQFKTPNTPYVAVTGDWCDAIGDRYQCFSDVTGLINANGTYGIANLKANSGQDDYVGGWELLIAYRDDAQRLRSLSVFDGHLQYNATTPRTFTFNGFLTPLAGPIQAFVTTSVSEGDAGSRDDATFKSQTQLLPRTLSQDLGNGTISFLGANVVTRSPAFRNTLGHDIDTFDVSTDMRNGDRSAVLFLPASTGEVNDWHKTDFAVDVYFPNVFATKTVVDLNGGSVVRGDTLRYTVTVRNDATALDAAIKVVAVDALPSGLDYVPGSIRLITTVLGGPANGVKTDVPADDIADYSAGSRTLTVRLGQGATATAGGKLIVGATTSFSFDAKVNASANGQIANVAIVQHEGETLAQQFVRPVAAPTDNPVTPAYDETIVTVSDDTDGDGLGDETDTDDDNDGITDIIEGGGVDPSADDDNDGIPNYRDPSRAGFLDTNNDGVDDRFDADLDGIPNHLDLDSDGDGLFDVDEHGGAAFDADNNGQIDSSIDLNLNGLADVVDGAIPNVMPLPGQDTDMDMTANFLDVDDDGDGIPTLQERLDVAIHGAGDLDNIPAWLDTDSDDDMILDADETLDIDVDGIPDYLDPSTRFLTAPVNGSTTNSNRPSTAGTVSTGASVLVEYVNAAGTVVATRTVNVNNGNGNWQTAPTVDLPDGTYTVRATATDSTGNSAVDSVTVTVDTVAPTLVISTPTQGQTVPTGIITGTTEPNAVVTVTFDPTSATPQVVTVTADAAGNWSAAPTSALADGAHSASAIATDAAGNQSPTRTRDFVIVSGTPVVINTPANGSLSNDSTPALSGTALPNTTVTLVLDAGTATEQTVVVTSNGAGAWFVFSPTLAEGPHTLTASADNGNGVPSQASSTFTVDTIAPAIAITDPSDGEFVGDANPPITGTSDPNLTVNIVIDGVAVGSTVADSNGDWSFTPTAALTEGAHVITATVSDPAGNTASDLVNIVVDLTPPTVTLTTPADGTTTGDTTPNISGSTEPGASVEVAVDGTVIGTAIADVNGIWRLVAAVLADGPHTATAVATDRAGNISAPATSTFNVDSNLLFVTIDSPTDGATTSETTPTIAGTSKPNAMVEIVVDGTPVGTTTADANGDFSFMLPNDLSEGPHIITASVMDNGITANDEVTINVDLTPPPLTVIEPIDGLVTSNSSPTISGETDPFTTVIIELPDGTIITLISDATGAFTYTPIDPIGEGPVIIVVTAVDPAGNETTEIVNITIDTISPALDITYPDDNGYIADGAVTFTGTSDPLAMVTVILDGVTIGTTTADANGNWSLPAPTPLADGVHNVVAQTSDAAGNLTQAEADFIVDSRAPDLTITAPVQGAFVALGVTSVSGITDPGLVVTVTIDGQLIGTATADANGMWSLEANGLALGRHTVLATTSNAAGVPATDEVDFIVGSPVVILQPANGGVTVDSTPTVSGTANPGDIVVIFVDGVRVGETTADANGAWTFELTDALANGEHTILADNGTTSAQTTFTVATNGGIVTITSPTDGGFIPTSTPTITGTATPGQVVEIFIDGVKVGETTANADGIWTFTPTEALAEGEHVIEARVPGNTTQIVVTVDTTAPTLTVTSPTQGAVIGTDVTVTGTSEPGAVIEIFVDGEKVGETVADENGDWSYDLTGLGEGSHVITVRATDAAGNAVEEQVTVTVGSATSLNYEVAGGCSSGGAIPSLLIFGVLGLLRRRRQA